MHEPTYDVEGRNGCRCRACGCRSGAGLNGEYVLGVTEVYLGEQGWLTRNVSGPNGESAMLDEARMGLVTERLSGHVELRPKE